MTKPGSIGPDIRAVMLCTWWSGPGARTGPLYRAISPLKISRRIQPWSGHLAFRLKPDWNITEMVCEDNVNFNPFLEKEGKAPK